MTLTAKRGNMPILEILLEEKEGKVLKKGEASLLNYYGFNNYEIVVIKNKGY